MVKYFISVYENDGKKTTVWVRKVCQRANKARFALIQFILVESVVGMSSFEMPESYQKWKLLM